MFLKKIIFFEQYRGYNLLYSEAGAVGAWHDIQGNGGRYMELQLVNEWVKSAEGCFAAGDMASMRACGRQMLEESPGNPVAMALIAEASVYMQDFQEAESWLEKMDQAVDKGGKRINCRSLDINIVIVHGSNSLNADNTCINKDP